MNLQRDFLPMGLLFALILAIIFPGLGILMNEYRLIDMAIGIIFLLGGYIYDLNGIKFSKQFLTSCFLIFLINLILAPLIAFGISGIFAGDMITTGFIIVAALPPTLTSGIVISELAGGDVIKAFVYTVGLNILGLITLPVILPFLLSGYSIYINPFNMFTNLLLFVFIPFVAGFMIRRFDSRYSTWKGFKYIINICIIICFFMGISDSRDQFLLMDMETVLNILLGIVVLKIIFSVLILVTAYFIKASFREMITMLFIGSQKTVSLAIYIVGMLSIKSAIPLCVCVLYYSLVLFFDSFAARIIGHSKAFIRLKMPVRGGN